MADSKITALTAISTVDPTADPLVIVDVSDTSMAASGTTKKGTINQLLGAGGTATLASATITGDLTVRTTGLTVNSSGVGVGVTAALGAGNIQIGAGKYLGYSATAYITPEDNVQGARIKANQVLIDATDAKFNIGGSEAMRLNSTGLGVGVAPELKLRVDGPDAAPATSGSSTTNGAFRIGAVGALTNLCVDAGVSTTGGVYGWFQARSRGNYALNYDIVLNPNGGNVGIGMNPANNLSIGSATYASFGVKIDSITQSSLIFKGTPDAAGYEHAKIVSGRESSPFTYGSFLAFYTEGKNSGTTDTSTERLRIDSSGNVISNVTGTAPTLATNSQMVFNLTSNTNLRISVRGTDGTTRTADITLV